jgi:hypothetical protein
MIIPSDCHNTERSWNPEREPLGKTLHRIGLRAPEFDRLTFVRVMYQHQRKEEVPSLKKLHWDAATNCGPLYNIVNGRAPGRWRIVTKNVFASLPPGRRCMVCNEQYLTSK